MPEIRQLDPHVADLIAAGEVVERTPASGRKPQAGDPMIIKGSSKMNLADPKVFARGENACTPHSGEGRPLQGKVRAWQRYDS